MDLSQRLSTVVEALVDGMPGRDLAARAARISEGYRDSRTSAQTVSEPTDALIYALTRMPATAAAVGAAFDALEQRLPSFMPDSVLDVGAGPGTASFVAGSRWPEARLTLCDAHPVFLDLARRLVAAELPDQAGRARFVAADLTRETEPLASADLVIASYALTEIGDGAYIDAARRLWAAASGVLVIVEPGRPRDFRRLLAFRDAALAEGAVVAAPCPHAATCPLEAEDWCHFSVRLPRSRSHKRLKGGALGYEDEKFSYLVLARPEIDPEPPEPRILAMPEIAKHEIRLKLCETDGSVGIRSFARRHSEFSRIRRARWGDCVGEGDVNQHQ